VFLAARRPFRAVIGVEISPALVEVARDNLAALEDPRGVARDVRFVRSERGGIRISGGRSGGVFVQSLRRAGARNDAGTLCAHDAAREIVLMYHTALQHATIEATQAFEVIADLGFGLVYRRRAM